MICQRLDDSERMTGARADANIDLLKKQNKQLSQNKQQQEENGTHKSAKTYAGTVFCNYVSVTLTFDFLS